MIISKAKSLIRNFNILNQQKVLFGDYFSKPKNGKKVLIYAGIGSMYITPFEILVYHTLKSEGYEVEYLIYDENIEINELITRTVVETIGKDKFWNNLVKESIKGLKKSNVDFSFIKESSQKINQLISSVENIESVLNFEYDEVLFGKIVKRTLYRFNKSLSISEKDFSIAKSMLRTSLINYFEIKDKNEINQYDFVFFSHGIYITWEPIIAYCKKVGLDFICYDRAKSKNTVNFNLNQEAPNWDFTKAWERYKDKELSVEERRMVSSYLLERELQINDVFAYNSSPRQKQSSNVRKQLNISREKKVITIFTNLIWDAANVSRDLVFESTLECIIQTIDRYKNHEQVHILIRTHPAEKILGTNDRYDALINEKFDNNLPKNVTILSPEMNINSFSVIDVSDIGVVNTSTVGLEFAMLGKPIILIAETHYRNKGFTNDITSRDNYFGTLDNLLIKNELLPNQIELAEKYFFMMMFLYQKEIPVNYENGILEGYYSSNFEKLKANKNMSLLLNKLREKETVDFIHWE